MKVSLEVRVDGDHTKSEIVLVAETPGEKAILHLLSDSDTALIHRDSSIHESYKLTERLYIRPERKP